MSNLIQIKRSLSTANATGLANGELAYTANGDVLWIGSNSGIVAIAGARTPGTLTANQALVANATSGIDKVIVANLVPTGIYANGAAGSTGQVLASNSTGGVYWSTPSAGVSGSDTQVQFNDGGLLAGDSGLTYNKTTDTLTIAGSVLAGATVNATALTVGTNIVANTTRLAIGTAVGLLANGGIGTAGQTLHSNGTTIYWATDDQGVTDVVAGNGLTGGGTSSQVTVSVGAANGISVSADTIEVTGANGISVTASGVNVLAGTGGGLVSNSTGVFVTAGSGLVANATGVHVGSGNGISVAADAVAVTGGSTLTVNATGVHVNSANLSIATSQLTGDIALGSGTSGNYVATITAGNGISGASATEGGTPTIAVVAGTNGGLVSNSTGVFVTASSGLVANATGVHVGAANGISVGADTVGLTTGSTLTVNSTGAHVNSTLQLSTLSVSGNATISGDLIVSGNLTTINVSSVSVADPLIKLAVNNSVSDTLWLGFTGHYNGQGNTTNHAGMARSPDNKEFYIFGTYGDETLLVNENKVNTADPSFTLANVNLYIKSSGLVTNGTHVAITANSTVNVSITANSLTLATPLAPTSGGLGLASYTSGDIIVANTGNVLSKLALGTSGYVLQSNGTALVYDTLDGGTF